MITLSGPNAASDEGSCNACNDQKGPDGLKPGSTVFTLLLSKTNNPGGTSVRLCVECLLDLTDQLTGVQECLK